MIVKLLFCFISTSLEYLSVVGSEFIRVDYYCLSLMNFVKIVFILFHFLYVRLVVHESTSTDDTKLFEEKKLLCSLG
jgi:hypothetical protein